MDELTAKAKLDYHIVVLTKIVKGALEVCKLSDGLVHRCTTCVQEGQTPSVIPHLSNCPVGDLQKLIDGATPKRRKTDG